VLLPIDPLDTNCLAVDPQVKSRFLPVKLYKHLPAGLSLQSHSLVTLFDRDLVAARLARQGKHSETGKVRIDKTNNQGRTLDIHSLRHTFATMLSQAQVAPRMAQEPLRHSDMRLTMNTCTHRQLIVTAGAVEALPALPLSPPRQSDTKGQQRTTIGKVVPKTVPSSVPKYRKTQSIAIIA